MKRGIFFIGLVIALLFSGCGMNSSVDVTGTWEGKRVYTFPSLTEDFRLTITQTSGVYAAEYEYKNEDDTSWNGPYTMTASIQGNQGVFEFGTPSLSYLKITGTFSGSRFSGTFEETRLSDYHYSGTISLTKR